MSEFDEFGKELDKMIEKLWRKVRDDMAKTLTKAKTKEEFEDAITRIGIAFLKTKARQSMQNGGCECIEIKLPNKPKTKARKKTTKKKTKKKR